jgi:hypothetical protein
VEWKAQLVQQVQQGLPMLGQAELAIVLVKQEQAQKQPITASMTQQMQFLPLHRYPIHKSLIQLQPCHLPLQSTL